VFAPADLHALDGGACPLAAESSATPAVVRTKT
jgi:hypothetical protein